jgi:hypothetical protein
MDNATRQEFTHVYPQAELETATRENFEAFLR